MAGQELVRAADIIAARVAVNELIQRGDGPAAERALAVFAPQTQALIVRSTFNDALARARAAGLKGDDAIHRAALTAEAVIEAVPEDAAAAVSAVDPQVLGAVLGARAGDGHSSVAELVAPGRIEELLTHVHGLWTTAAELTPEDFGIMQFSDRLGEGDHVSSFMVGGIVDPDRGKPAKRIPSPHQLLKLLWTILQTADERAQEIFAKLPIDLLAVPFADAFARRDFTCDQADGTEDDDAGVDPTDKKSIRQLLADDNPHPLKLDDILFSDGTLVQFRDRLHELSPERCETVIIHAAKMSECIKAVLEDIGAEADERARGETSKTPPVQAAEDMFAPLGDQGSGKTPPGR